MDAPRGRRATRTPSRADMLIHRRGPFPSARCPAFGVTRCDLVVMRVTRRIRVAGVAGLAGLIALGALAACRGQERALGAAPAASPPLGDVPQMLNAQPPFRYPAELYDRRVQGDVMLRLHVDARGQVRPESTTIVTSSGYPAFDSAAVAGTRELTFTPAVRKGRAIGRSIRFPVWFRSP